MKKVLLSCLVFVFLGCSYEMETYIKKPGTILKDPLTVDYRQEMNDLERAYLRKEMTYAQYLDRKNELEESYAMRVQKREGN